MNITIIVFKDYGICTVTEGKSRSEYLRTIDAIKKNPEFVAYYETTSEILFRQGTDQRIDKDHPCK